MRRTLARSLPYVNWKARTLDAAGMIAQETALSVRPGQELLADGLGGTPTAGDELLPPT